MEEEADLRLDVRSLRTVQCCVVLCGAVRDLGLYNSRQKGVGVKHIVGACFQFGN